jgi:hypothetical protein
VTAWAAIDCDIDSHPKLAALPSDAARYGWIRTLLEAKRQRRPGRFASAAHFRHVLGRHGKFLKDYLAANLLEEDGTEVVVHDWTRHQWASSKARQRETSRGHSEDKDETPVGPDLDASRAVVVHVPVDVSNDGERVQGEGAETEPWLRAWLGVRHRMPTPGQQRVIDSFLDTFDVTGPERLARLILENSGDPLDAVIKELKAFRAARLGEIEEEVAKPRAPRRRSGLDPVGDELKRIWAEQGRGVPESVA